ncbi:MAG: hypothetical protein NVV82_27040 [Sporocytophaga sp.]|nr:hypothetical protein [Sporocytophaga sp.]
MEYEAFNKYLGDKRVKKDELIVVFNKKQDSESFSFFSIFSKERIGTGQFALAILINIACGFLFFLPAYRESSNNELKLYCLPIEIYLAFGLALSTFIYFTWPTFQNAFSNMSDMFKKKKKK